VCVWVCASECLVFVCVRSIDVHVLVYCVCSECTVCILDECETLCRGEP